MAEATALRPAGGRERRVEISDRPFARFASYRWFVPGHAASTMVSLFTRLAMAPYAVRWSGLFDLLCGCGGAYAPSQAPEAPRSGRRG